MEENVALDSTKQKKFAKSIKGIKKLLKKKDNEPHKPAVLAPKDGASPGDKKKKKRKERGLVYLSHIPHGFYEHQMTQYFKQFGMVTNVRVIRSPRTGRSKGFGFVEFREPAVAEIVAETMNNYLMGKRLIKAVVIPPEKQKRRAFRKHWNENNNPTVERRQKIKKEYNATKDEAGDLKKAHSLYQMLQNKKKKFNALGLSIDFFKPVDVPKVLLEKEVKKESESETKVKVEDGKKKKTKAETVESIKKEKKTESKNTKEEVKSKKEMKKEEETNKTKQKEKEKKLKDSGMKLPENFIQIQPESDDESDSSVDFDSDEYEKMLANDSGESSDEESDDDIEDGEDDSEDEDEDDESGDEELPSPIPIKVKKGKKQGVAPPPQPKIAAKQANLKKEKQIQQKQDQSNQEEKKPQGQNQIQKKIQAQPQKPQLQVQKNPQGNKQNKPQAQGNKQNKPQPQGNKQNKPQPQGNKLNKLELQGNKQNKPQVHTTQQEGKGVKRKNAQPEVSPKKPKFEKQDKKHRNKQFKKKNKAN